MPSQSLLLLVISFFILVSNSFMVTAANTEVPLFKVDHSKYNVELTLERHAFLHEANNVIYNTIVDYNDSLKVQVFQLNASNQFEFSQQLIFNSDFGDYINGIDLLKVVGENLLAISSDAYLIFNIEDDGRLKYHKKVDLSHNFSNQLLYISDDQILTFDNLGVPVKHWKFDHTAGTLEFVATLQGRLSYTQNGTFYDADAEQIIQIKTWPDLIVTRYNVSFNEGQISEVATFDNSTIKNLTSASLSKFNQDSKTFYFRGSEYETFFTVDDQAKITVKQQTASPLFTMAHYDDSDTYVEMLDFNGSYNPRIKAKINWQTYQVEKTELSLDSLPYFDTYQGEWRETKGSFEMFLAANIVVQDFGHPINRKFVTTIAKDSLIDKAEMVLGGANGIPSQLKQAKFDQGSKQLMLLGDGLTMDSPTLFIWDYLQADNDFEYLQKIVLQWDREVHSSSNFGLIGQYKNNYYLLRKSYPDNQTQLIRVSEENGVLTEHEGYVITLNGAETAITQSFFIGPNLIALLHYNREKPMMSYCQLSDSGDLQTCTTKDIFPEVDFNLVASEDFRFNELASINQFLFAPNSNNLMINVPEHYLLSFNAETLSFTVQQTFAARQDNYNPSWAEKINGAYITADGKDLYISYNDIVHFKFDNNTDAWQASGKESHFSSSEFMANESGELMLNHVGQLLFLDTNDNKFYYYYNDNRLSLNSPWYTLLPNNKGVGISRDGELLTFTITKLKPSIYKGGLGYQNIMLEQDKVFEFDLSPYFLNPEALVINGLPESLSYQAPFIRGSLTNEDMFKSVNSNEPADRIRLEFIADDDTYGRPYIDLTPVNINDAPVLMVTFTKEYLQTGVGYELRLDQLIVDPDRDPITFTYENVPRGFETYEGGVIQGVVSKTGLHNMVITATDIHGSSISVTMVLEFTKDGLPKSDKGSSSGSGTLNIWLLWLLWVSLVTKGLLIKNCNKAVNGANV